MLALLNEFSNTSRSTKLGISNDAHFMAKRSFEVINFENLTVVSSVLKPLFIKVDEMVFFSFIIVFNKTKKKAKRI
jgi:hypothetical protein